MLDDIHMYHSALPVTVANSPLDSVRASVKPPGIIVLK